MLGKNFGKSINKYFRFNQKKFISKDMILKNSNINIYNGVEFELEKVILNPLEKQTDFKDILDFTLNEWDKISVRSITVKIPSNLTDYIKYFIQKEFYFHHTNEKDIYLCKWLDKSTNDMIPKFAHHHTGIGACIINQNLDFLLIKEKYRPTYTSKSHKKLLWKFVTGLIEEGESLVNATYREVKEEVSLEVDYHGCIIFSESYPNSHKISDICFFNLCTLKSLCEPKINLNELSEARFFSIKEVEKLLSQNETTILTKKTMNKLIPMIDFKISLEENIRKIKSKGLFLNTEVDLKDLNYKINYLNVFH
jgi:ADP-ribose pyrophosphatase YjhB (NUDIX family)